MKIKNTAFNTNFGEINLIPIFGSNFTIYFPILLCFFCLFNLFDIFPKILNYIGLEQFNFSKSFNSKLIE